MLWGICSGITRAKFSGGGGALGVAPLFLNWGPIFSKILNGGTRGDTDLGWGEGTTCPPPIVTPLVLCHIQLLYSNCCIEDFSSTIHKIHVWFYILRTTQSQLFLYNVHIKIRKPFFIKSCWIFTGNKIKVSLRIILVVESEKMLNKQVIYHHGWILY